MAPVGHRTGYADRSDPHPASRGPEWSAQGSCGRRNVPAGDAQTGEEFEAVIRSQCMTIYHQSSTCRVGTDAAAVVDRATLKFHRIERLCVADASAIPAMASGNLNTSTVLIAERVASSTRS
ncbi:GMC oxidoreductase [Heliomarina baculiformis]|uniref:GMC oxidoreductase n=1 Tax=Heliomarina baculiformis TaxID=2872036 RepID=UPI00308033AF